MIRHVRTYIFRGFLALIPFGLAYLAVRTVYVSIDQRIADVIRDRVGFGFPGLGILLLLISLYLLGLLVSNYLGGRTLAAVENVTRRIPFVKTVYGIGKQISDSLGRSGQEVFKRPVLVRTSATGMWSIGFVTGTLVDNAEPEVRYLKVYVPLPPNPTAGMLMVVKESDTRDPKWSVEDALTCVMSGGMIGPKTYG